MFEVVNASRVASPTSSLSWRRTVDGPGLAWDYWMHRWFAVAPIHVLIALAARRITATRFSLRPPLHGRSPTPSTPPRFLAMAGYVVSGMPLARGRVDRCVRSDTVLAPASDAIHGVWEEGCDNTPFECLVQRRTPCLCMLYSLISFDSTRCCCSSINSTVNNSKKVYNRASSR